MRTLTRQTGNAYEETAVRCIFDESPKIAGLVEEWPYQNEAAFLSKPAPFPIENVVFTALRPSSLPGVCFGATIETSELHAVSLEQDFERQETCTAML